jgi:hypothetical protein
MRIQWQIKTTVTSQLILKTITIKSIIAQVIKYQLHSVKDEAQTESTPPVSFD